MLIRITIRSNIIAGAIFKILSRSFYAEILALQGFPAGLRASYFIRDKSGYPEQLEVGHGAGVGFSGIFNEPLSLRVKQGVVTAVGVFVDFAVPYTFKAPGTGQSFAETADAGEHIDEFNQAPGSLWTWVLFWAYLIGTPHQKQKQPVTGCTEQDFFTVHNV